MLHVLPFQSLDTSEFEPLLDIAFGSPVMDQDSIPSFGTPLTCANLCLRLLNKVFYVQVHIPILLPHRCNDLCETFPILTQ